MSQRKRILAWGGFVDGKLDAGFVLDPRSHPVTLTPLYAVFRTRAVARRMFEDVRRVEILTARKP